ncbi:MAG: TonB-dependent receptor [Gemmatimonadetes bacterium]|nr:TonB-dependent receptor [Gemmatimonadota bacterium]
MKRIPAIVCLAAAIFLWRPGSPLLAQRTASVTTIVTSEGAPVAEALVRAGGVLRRTDASGSATLPLLAGTRTIRVEKLGFTPETVSIGVRQGADTTLAITLLPRAEELEGVVVSSTRRRTASRIEDEPLRVEVLAQEEVEEKLLMTPGDIAMMLNETSGLRVQNTSPSLGGANVRIQGLTGRYTQILSDGLPLYGGQSGSLSMLQIPPMDLGQVEVIKGTASALYGSSALGGVINLISRRPERERELLLNQTTLGGTDGVLWVADELSEQWGYTLLGGAHRQGQADVDGDGWADLPGYTRGVLRPRLFWNDGAGRSLFLTVGTTVENRSGGTREGRLTPAGNDFPEELETRRADAGVVGRFLVGGERLLTVRGSLSGQRHRHLFGDSRERDAHATAFAEVAYAGETARNAWVVGAAFQRESYDAAHVAGFDFGYSIPSLFAQNELAPARWLTLALSGRLDGHSEYGTFLNPRVSVLFRPGAWTARASLGTGYFAPTPFTDETEAVGLRRVLPLGRLRAERARSASFDLGRTVAGVELNATAFASRVEHPLQVLPMGGSLRVANAPGPTRTFGGEMLARWSPAPFHLTATYTHLRSTEDDPDRPGRRPVPLTPRHAAGIVGMWEEEGTGRVGLELYYTGRQSLDENPYRDTSRPYLIMGLLVERRVGRARLFLNAENLLDVRQSRYEPLLLPARSPEGRWTTDAWAPLEGRTVNGGVRLEL